MPGPNSLILGTLRFHGCAPFDFTTLRPSLFGIT